MGNKLFAKNRYISIKTGIY